MRQLSSVFGQVLVQDGERDDAAVLRRRLRRADHGLDLGQEERHVQEASNPATLDSRAADEPRV